MSYPAVALEGGPVMNSRLLRHMEPELACPQNAERPGPHSIPRQDINTSVPVQGIIGLAQVEEYGMEDRLPHGNGMSKQIFLEGGGHRYYPRAKAMQSVMELDGRQYMAIDDSGYCLLQDLQQANTPEAGA